MLCVAIFGNGVIGLGEEEENVQVSEVFISVMVVVVKDKVSAPRSSYGTPPSEIGPLFFLVFVFGFGGNFRVDATQQTM